MFFFESSVFIILVQFRELVTTNFFDGGYGFEVKALLLPEKGESLGVFGKASLESSLLVITERAAAEIKGSSAAVLV